MASPALSLKATRALAFGRPINQSVLHVVLVVFSFVGVSPFVWMLFASFKKYRELVTSPDLLPHVWTVDNYLEVFNRLGFLGAFANSVIIATSTTATVLLTSSMMGYVFAKYRFAGKEVFFTALLATMMVPFAVVLVPLYIFISAIGASDHISGIILPGLYSTFGIFLMRQFMETIPGELLDAARIDGASEWRIFAQLVAPLSGAPLAALAILHFLSSWDSFLWPSIVLTSPEQQTLPVILNALKSLYWSRYDMWIAGSMLTIVPVMTIYAFASKQFVRGVAMTGLKG
jgi:multiple sugar transport system permease protein